VKAEIALSFPFVLSFETLREEFSASPERYPVLHDSERRSTA